MKESDGLQFEKQIGRWILNEVNRIGFSFFEVLAHIWVFNELTRKWNFIIMTLINQWMKNSHLLDMENDGTLILSPLIWTVDSDCNFCFTIFAVESNHARACNHLFENVRTLFCKYWIENLEERSKMVVQVGDRFIWNCLWHSRILMGELVYHLTNFIK